MSTHHKAFVCSTAPLTVKLIGSTSEVEAASNTGYTPTVGDEVAVVHYDGTLLVICPVTH